MSAYKDNTPNLTVLIPLYHKIERTLYTSIYIISNNMIYKAVAPMVTKILKTFLNCVCQRIIPVVDYLVPIPDFESVSVIAPENTKVRLYTTHLSEMAILTIVFEVSNNLVTPTSGRFVK